MRGLSGFTCIPRASRYASPFTDASGPPSFTVLTSSEKVTSPSPLTTASISGNEPRLSEAVMKKCMPPVTVQMSGSTFLAACRVLATW